MNFSDKRVLVTGGAGFIGYHLCKALVRQNAEVIVYDNLTEERSPIRLRKLRQFDIEFVEGDVLDRERLMDVTKDVNVIYHLAAKSRVAESFYDPISYCRVNVVGTINALEAAKKANALFIFTSSSTVYGKAKMYPTPEGCPCRPISVYGLTKLMAEELCELYGKLYRVAFVNLRIFNVYGPEMSTGVMYDFLWKLKLDKNKLEVIGSGEQTKDYVYISDVVDVLLKIPFGKKVLQETYNLGSGTSTSVKEIVKTTLDLLNLREIEVLYGAQPTWPGDIPYTLADITKLKGHLGWEPTISLKNGLKRTIAWFKKEIGWSD